MYKFEVFDQLFLPGRPCQIQLNLEKTGLCLLKGENGVGKTTLVHRIYQKNQALISLIQQKPIDAFFDRKLERIRKIFLSHPQVEEETFSHLWKGFGLAEKEDRMFSQVSGGEFQALKLCMGLSVKKEIFFMDEPFLSLDKKSAVFLATGQRKSCRNFLKTQFKLGSKIRAPT
jgi:NitT/TauT family transport system ATP-binding protein